VIDAFLSQVWVQRLGWTLVHFLWQGTAIAILYAALRGALGRSLSAQGRYVLACLTLGAMTAAPPLTFLLIPIVDGGAPPDWWNISADQWQNILPCVVVVWLLGVAAFSIRLAAGWRFTVRLRAASHPAPPEWQQVVQRTAARVGASRPVRLLVSSLAEVPMVIGWLRPAILVPVGSLTGLPLEHMTALLAHELAHIRRQDYLASILQSVAESLLFYHPAVWWVSQQIRTERELCCDDLAVAASGDVLTYARALAELESQRMPRLSPAPAATGGSLVNRVRRLIEPSQAAADILPGPGVAWAMSLLWIAGIGVATAHAAQVNNDRIMFLRAAPEAILYDPFLPSPQALGSRYGKPHSVLPNGPDLWRPVPGSLSNKYGKLHNVGRGSTERLRQDATYAPLPQYPQFSLQAGNQGLVVIEVVVAPEGRARESLILASFDKEASAAVTAALNAWRFHSDEELSEIFKNRKKGGVRIGRLGFEFRIANGKGGVVDLAAAEVKRRGLPSPFLRRQE
jgi:beta-lactamase regulating signal transducer with metallopeptidase domain